MSKKNRNRVEASKAADDAPTAAEKPSPAAESKSDEAGSKDAAAKERSSNQGSIRETIESVVIAFVLAFLFRGFEAEAFVIPTGSMAPTLTGLHKDMSGSLGCPKCGQSYFVGATDEVNHETNEQLYDSQGRPVRIGSATCPNCAYPAQIGPKNPQGKDYYSYSGDRILVSKFAYQWQDPDRWDVVVFKYPVQAQRNYIKRLVGKPGETVRIYQGDIYIRNDAAGEKVFRIAAKPPNKLRAMLQLVYDNDRSVPAIEAAGWAPRWTALADAGGADQPPAQPEWTPEENGQAFRTAGGSQWLRYRHLPPMVDQWRALEQAMQNGSQAAARPQPTLIADYTAYNSGIYQYNYDTGQADDFMSALGQNWVGDLTLDCQVEASAPTEGAAIRLELVRGARLECRFDLTSGVATLLKDGAELASSKGPTPVRGAGKWDLSFANVDQHLTVWVNGAVLEFTAVTEGGPATPARQIAYHLSPAIPTAADLAPAGVAVVGAGAAVRHLKVWRDIYYIAASVHNQGKALDLPEVAQDYYSLVSFLRDPSGWDAFRNQREAEFPLGDDEFFVLGDNSARSADSRLWPERSWRSNSHPYAVKRDLLIGKALFIYWPHAWETPINVEVSLGMFGRVRVPFYPNFQRMQLIR